MKFELPEFENKHVVFIGEGREWKSFETFIKIHANIQSLQSIFVTDENRDDINQKLASLDLSQNIVVKTAGYPGSLVPIEYTTPTKVFFKCARQLGAKIVGVTGTKGKSTTASLLDHILKNAGKPVLLGGNIGVPMLDLLPQASENTIFVIELSSYQLNELDQSPDMAIITNLYRDHIDYHGSLENYWEAKRNIVRFMNPSNSIIFNPNTEIVFHWIAEVGAKGLPIDINEKIDMTQSQLIGDHNRLNYLLARNAALELGADRFACQGALKTFKPISHRLEKVRTVRGITYIDDAIASQPEAAIAGITACIREIGPVGCVLLGGQDRDYDFTELAKLLHTLMIPKLVLFPDTGAKIKALFPEHYTPEIFETSNMAEAVKWTAEHVPSGSVCLLSSASPSYSLWKDFEDKGEQFQKAVLELSNS